MGVRVWEMGIVMIFVVLWGRLTCAEDLSRVSFSRASLCPPVSALDSFFAFRDWTCTADSFSRHYDFEGVIEGDEASLQMALNMVHKYRYEYVALLLYASWCPFSGSFGSRFSTLSSLYPSIPHFAIEESVIRPSILSKYGVHGFPALFIFNSTMRVRYYGSRTVGSLVSFYSDVTGIKTEAPDHISLGRLGSSTNQEKHDNSEQENCPFTWARSPENLLRQETYLALATAFVVLRLIYLIFPTLALYARYAWRRHVQNVRLWNLWEHPLMLRATQLCSSLKEPCKRRNLQEGAMSARAWASKSLATVSIGDASSSRCMGGSESH